MNTTYLTLKEAAVYLKLCKSTLYKMTSSREIPFYKPGGKLILFLKEDLEEYLANNRFDAKKEIENNYLTNLIVTK